MTPDNLDNIPDNIGNEKPRRRKEFHLRVTHIGQKCFWEQRRISREVDNYYFFALVDSKRQPKPPVYVYREVDAKGHSALIPIELGDWVLRHTPGWQPLVYKIVDFSCTYSDEGNRIDTAVGEEYKWDARFDHLMPQLEEMAKEPRNGLNGIYHRGSKVDIKEPHTPNYFKGVGGV